MLCVCGGGGGGGGNTTNLLATHFLQIDAEWKIEDQRFPLTIETYEYSTSYHIRTYVPIEHMQLNGTI